VYIKSNISILIGELIDYFLARLACSYLLVCLLCVASIYTVLQQAFPVICSWRSCMAKVWFEGKGKWNIAVRNTPQRYGNSHAMWDNTVLPATLQR